ncbi:hypothetical protein COLO4_36686 [Corchorus olitorius]|uniref:Uncharacterized protein n=1 Tax=Corchorus olitorius TaxID=93759 RepID=A0A1R3G6C0_9ROSI|nr:hypothetical protein COLO4_36686 [Corchorus olitorius]
MVRCRDRREVFSSAGGVHLEGNEALLRKTNAVDRFKMTKGWDQEVLSFNCGDPALRCGGWPGGAISGG